MTNGMVGAMHRILHIPDHRIEPSKGLQSDNGKGHNRGHDMGTIRDRLRFSDLTLALSRSSFLELLDNSRLEIDSQVTLCTTRAK